VRAGLCQPPGEHGKSAIGPALTPRLSMPPPGLLRADRAHTWPRKAHTGPTKDFFLSGFLAEKKIERVQLRLPSANKKIASLVDALRGALGGGGTKTPTYMCRNHLKAPTHLVFVFVFLTASLGLSYQGQCAALHRQCWLAVLSQSGHSMQHAACGLAPSSEQL
jgi:hypothetical protein